MTDDGKYLVMDGKPGEEPSPMMPYFWWRAMLFVNLNVGICSVPYAYTSELFVWMNVFESNVTAEAPRPIRTAFASPPYFALSMSSNRLLRNVMLSPRPLG
jgi:hypothetical protein